MQLLAGPTLAVSRRLCSTPGLVLSHWSLNGFHVSTANPENLFHEVKDKESGKVRRIAYNKTSGPRSHGLLYIPGFMGHKGGGKPVALHSFSQKYGFPFLRYDPSGLGESEGMTKAETRFSIWLEDAKEMLLNVAEGPQIVICSSMGCWITSHLIQMHPEKFAGILMLAPAVNFHSRYEKVLRAQLTPKLLQKFEEGGVVPLYAPDYGEFPLTKAHFQDMKKFALTREPEQIPVPVPLRIIHGVKDKDVPYTESLPLMHSFKTEDVHLSFLKHAGHTLVDKLSLELIYDTILKLAAEVQQRNTQ